MPPFVHIAVRAFVPYEADFVLPIANMKPPVAPSAQSPEPETERRLGAGDRHGRVHPVSLDQSRPEDHLDRLGGLPPAFRRRHHRLANHRATGAEPWIAPVRICEATGLDKAAVSRSLRGLLKAGLVEARAEEPSRRRLPVALTAKGLAVHDRILMVALKRQEQLLADFSSAERDQLRDFIARMRRRVESIETEV